MRGCPSRWQWPPCCHSWWRWRADRWGTPGHWRWQGWPAWWWQSHCHSSLHCSWDGWSSDLIQRWSIIENSLKVFTLVISFARHHYLIHHVLQQQPTHEYMYKLLSSCFILCYLECRGGLSAVRCSEHSVRAEQHSSTKWPRGSITKRIFCLRQELKICCLSIFYISIL